MFFGATTFAQAPFSDVGSNVISPIVIVSGNQINVANGTIATIPAQKIGTTGFQINVATGSVSVITWNPIPPGASQVWVPIDPNNP